MQTARGKEDCYLLSGNDILGAPEDETVRKTPRDGVAPSEDGKGAQGIEKGNSGAHATLPLFGLFFPDRTQRLPEGAQQRAPCDDPQTGV